MTAVTGSIAPAPWFTALDDDGSIIPGALMYTFLAGTSTPLPTFSDLALTVPNSNPVVCDSAGRCLMFCSAATYKYTLKRPDFSLVRSQDSVPATSITNSGSSVAIETFYFGGDITAPIVATDYPTGTGYDKLHAGTSFYRVDSANLVGTYAIQAMLMGSGGGAVSVAIVNLTDAPDAPLAVCSSDDPLGALITSSDITFAAGGVVKTYGIKAMVDQGAGFAWAIRLVRTS